MSSASSVSATHNPGSPGAEPPLGYSCRQKATGSLAATPNWELSKVGAPGDPRFVTTACVKLYGHAVFVASYRLILSLSITHLRVPVHGPVVEMFAHN